MPIPSVKHGRPNRRRSAQERAWDSHVTAALSAGHSGIIGLVVDPSRPETEEIVRGAFGEAGMRDMGYVYSLMPGSFVAMVGWIRREPARIGAFLPHGAEAAVGAIFEKACDLGDTSTWIVLLPDEHQVTVTAMLAQRSATAGPMQ